MPVATYGPLAGKYGRIASNNTTLNLAEHEIRAGADDLDTTHFESDTSSALATPPPANYNVFEEGLVGIVSGAISVRGSFDSLNNPFDSPIFLWVGNYGDVFLGLTKTYGFTCGYRCLGNPISTSVRGKAGFEATLRSNGLIAPPVGNNA